MQFNGHDRLVPPRQHGASWRESEFRLLAARVRAGIGLREIAAELGRTPSAVQAALRNVVPPGERVRANDRAGWFQDRMAAEPEWDWWSVVVEHHQHSASVLWLTDDEHTAREAWGDRTPMPVLAQRLHTSELSVAEFLRALGLAESLAEVADRLGATPGHALAKRVRAARDQDTSASWVLVVDGAEGTVRPRSAPVKRHVSVYESRAAAEAGRDRVLRWHRRNAGDSAAPVWWTIAQRGVGDMAGRTYCGIYGPRDTEGGVRADTLMVGDHIRVASADGVVLDAVVESVEHSAGVVVVDLGPIADSRVRQVIEFDAAERVEVLTAERAES
ncbi:hypothetical protein GV794_28070 [Nocardia cyriacigeorgica]|uniref:Uncharacterized protein n=2 Tax=Nocardia cyriacigeorgica TaxID=135487 RepID=A0A6P1DHA2_9NOCA|nr:hypothetical protein [Nocardia cyriacigeorgica]NEW42632.1 hypothetical protein [Nocardia cyriacigeorgica]NEW47752.1 hypothetical protein [Nocardia cyriacigeorgica]NEW51457.1 hypothetical protein [Nocardia cyriacigeorgica]NEW59457.1 hypothetical protein [Nocardia cyriacigeorgica]